MLYLFILSQLGNAQDAEEVLQETNLVIWSKCGQYQLGTNFGAWARQIAVYEVLKWRQRQHRDRLRFSDEFLTAVARETAQRTAELDRRQRALEQCLKKLRTEDRELINQRYQPGQSGKSIAKALGRPANSVYQSLGRIRRTLLECVQRQMKAPASA